MSLLYLALVSLACMSALLHTLSGELSVVIIPGFSFTACMSALLHTLSGELSVVIIPGFSFISLYVSSSAHLVR